MNSYQVETVRIRDKSVEGGVRIINKEDLTDNDVIMDEKPAGKNSKSKDDGSEQSGDDK